MESTTLLPTAYCGPPAPLPGIGINVRSATMDDVLFIDQLQKMHSKQVGFMPTKALEGKIRLGHILIAEEVASCQLPVASEDAENQLATDHSQLATPPATPPANPPANPPATRVGYLIGNDQYFKRDDVGIIYQMNVLPGKQRGLVGATLLKAQFERSAYGCRLYCCWCAQDIAANRFWEAMGFVPLAFRAGSRTKGKNGTARVHLFWQRRIRSGDTGDVSKGGTPWWFPSQTAGGSIREDRLVIPIPPGKNWADEMPRILPELPVDSCQLPVEEVRRLPGPRVKKVKQIRQGPCQISLSRLSFAPVQPVHEVKEKKQPRKKVKNDPKLVAAARELRDRWLEQVNARELVSSGGKYEVSRQIHARVMLEQPQRMIAA